MTAPRGCRHVEVLRGGEVLVRSPEGVTQLLRALEFAARHGRRDGIRLPRIVVDLIAEFSAAQALATSAAEVAEVGFGADVPLSPQTLIGTREVAEMLKISERAVRLRCAAGAFETAIGGDGRPWEVDRREVLAEARRRQGLAS